MLKDTMIDERKFGGCVVVTFGDPEQLPPMMANSVREGACTGDGLAGQSLHVELTTVGKWTENNRLDANNPDAVMFDNFLDKLRCGENMEEDQNILREKCSLLAMGLDAWKNKGFNDDDVNRACFTSKLVN